MDDAEVSLSSLDNMLGISAWKMSPTGVSLEDRSDLSPTVSIVLLGDGDWDGDCVPSLELSAGDNIFIDDGLPSGSPTDVPDGVGGRTCRRGV